MNRREWLTQAVVAATVLATDPFLDNDLERLLWTPGRKAIFLPPQNLHYCGTDGCLARLYTVTVYHLDSTESRHQLTRQQIETPGWDALLWDQTDPLGYSDLYLRSVHGQPQ